MKIFRRRQFETQMDAELRFHIEERIEAPSISFH